MRFASRSDELLVFPVAHHEFDGIDDRFWIDVAAVALASPRDASELFDKFVGQWQRCQGKTLIYRHEPDEVGIPDYLSNITDVQSAGTMLTAVVLVSSSDGHALSPDERAVGVAYNCILDVKVTEASGQHDDATTTGHARDVVKLMMAKAGA